MPKRSEQEQQTRTYINRWRRIRGVRSNHEDGPTLRRALDTFGEQLVDQVLDYLTAGDLIQVRHPLKFFWGCCRHWDRIRKKQDVENERAARTRARTEDLIARRARWPAEATHPPAETFRRLRVLADEAAELAVKGKR